MFPCAPIKERDMEVVLIQVCENFHLSVFPFRAVDACAEGDRDKWIHSGQTLRGAKPMEKKKGEGKAIKEERKIRIGK